MQPVINALVAGAMLFVPFVAPPDDDSLGSADFATGNTGKEVTVKTSQQINPQNGTTPVQNVDWLAPIEDWWQPPANEQWIPPEQAEFDRCLAAWDSNRPCFVPSEDGEEGEKAEEEESAGIPPITITDLARFAPAGSTVTGEPENVGVAGLPTNFVTTASVQTVTGDLFGFPVSVRFTPSAYDFSFGDGDTVTTTSAGTTWSDLGQAQFTPTDTSHTYRERGTYIARADVRYTAEVDFGIGWFPISGEVTSTGAAQEVRIFEAHTALVAHTCAQAPSSPGC